MTPPSLDLFQRVGLYIEFSYNKYSNEDNIVDALSQWCHITRREHTSAIYERSGAIHPAGAKAHNHLNATVAISMTFIRNRRR